jgi:hypothetical protein
VSALFAVFLSPLLEEDSEVKLTPVPDAVDVNESDAPEEEFDT